jgi:hypothetical protein
MEHCDWGLNYDDGIGMLLPHLTRSRDLARLAALHARSEYARGNRGALPANATAMMTLARHVGRDPIMICLLVRFGIEDFVVDLVSLCATEITIPHARAVKLFEELPAAPDLQAAVDAERQFFIEWMIKKLHEEEDREPGAAAKLWQNMLGAEGPAELKQITSFAKMVQCLEGINSVYRELEQVVALPKKEFDAQYPEFKKRVTAEKPLARFLVPNVEELLAKEHRNQARFAMLLAAIAVNESGPEALKTIKDPFGDGPFEYRAVEGGFELQSKLEFEGKPVTLTAGRKQAK